MCGPKSSTRYHGRGDVADRQGTRFTFGLAPSGPVPGKHLSGIEGIWDGEDRLELTTRLYTQGPEGAIGDASIAARPQASDRTGVIWFEMRRSTEEAFDAACRD